MPGKRNKDSIGARISNRRVDMGYKQEQISEFLNITPNYYGEIERNKKKPSRDLLAKIAETLQVSLDYIMFGSENEEAAAVMNEETSEYGAKVINPQKVSTTKRHEIFDYLSNLTVNELDAILVMLKTLRGK